MEENLPPSHEFSPIPLRMGLIFVLLASSAGVFSAAAWIYRRVHNGLGLEIAEVVMAFLAILILALIVIGFRMGFQAKRALGQQEQPEAIAHLCERLACFQRLWMYLAPHAEAKGEIHAPVAEEKPVEITMLPNRAAKRGRPPTYPFDRWVKVVNAWDNRNPWRDTLTLQEFLSQEFGIYADGSPRISKKTFYDWQKKVHEQAEKQLAAKNELLN
jgi:hypothetical protein